MKSIPEAIVHFKRMEAAHPSMYREVKWQFANMANGGGGGTAGSGRPEDQSIRENYYDGRTDKWFQEVCDLMGWKR
jgi:hypothetical protein